VLPEKSNKMKVLRREKIWILIILIAASALRLYDLFRIPFTYDELSALFRTRFDSLSDLIEYGVRIDGHPAGIQLFLFLLTKLVGFSEVWIKFPFIIAGIASVYLIWRIGREWFSPRVGLLAAATLTAMHYFIVFSQIARPYSSGLFFTLLMVLGWSRIVVTKSGSYGRNLFMFIAGAVLCSYNHHFTLLMAALTGVTGIFLVKGKELYKYLIACAAIVILYLPHLGITLYQLSMGGVEQWLSKPTPHFFIDYGKYIFHFSKFAAVFFGVIILYGIIETSIRKEVRIRRPHVIALVLGVVPIVIGYAYSVYVASLLQFSILLFSFPFLILLVLSVFQHVGWRQTEVIITLWTAVLVFTLIDHREHYKYFYHSPFEESAIEIKAFTQTHPSDSTLVICSYRSEVADFYKEKYNISPKLKYVYPDQLKNTLELKRLLNDTTYHYLIFTKTNESKPWLYALTHEYFPKISLERNYNQGSCIIMKRGENHYNNYLAGSLCTFDSNTNKDWIFDGTHVLKDTLEAATVLQVDSMTQYAATWVKPAAGFIRSRANIIDATAWIYLPDTFSGSANWVASLETDTGAVSWNATPISLETLPVGRWSPVSVSIFLPDIAEIPANAVIKVYISNENKKAFLVKQTYAGIRAGNPAIYWITYGLFE